MSGRVLDLFCGAAGGWSLGLHRAGYRTVAACEIDPWRRAVFGRNNPGAVLYDDIRTLTAARLANDGIAVDVVVGSPPCKNASTAGTAWRKGKKLLSIHGKQTGLFAEAIRLVGETQPIWGCFENVPALINNGGDIITSNLEDVGYKIWWFQIPAGVLGAPHWRNRVWIIFVRNDKVDSAIYNSDSAWGRALCGRGERCHSEIRKKTRENFLYIGSVWQEIGIKEEVFSQYDSWNNGAAFFGGVDDGVRGRVDSTLSEEARIISAYGDAVVPQITEAIGRAVARLLPVEAPLFEAASA